MAEVRNASLLFIVKLNVHIYWLSVYDFYSLMCILLTVFDVFVKEMHNKYVPIVNEDYTKYYMSGYPKHYKNIKEIKELQH